MDGFQEVLQLAEEHEHASDGFREKWVKRNDISFVRKYVPSK